MTIAGTVRRNSDAVAQDDWNQGIVAQQRPPDRGSFCPYCDSENGWHQMSRQMLRWGWDQEPEADYNGYYEMIPAEWCVYTRCGYCNRADAKRDGMREVESEKLWQWCHEESDG